MYRPTNTVAEFCSTIMISNNNFNEAAAFPAAVEAALDVLPLLLLLLELLLLLADNDDESSLWGPPEEEDAMDNPLWLPELIMVVVGNDCNNWFPVVVDDRIMCS